MITFQSYQTGDMSFTRILDQLRGSNDENRDYVQHLFRLGDDYRKVLGLFTEQPLFMLFQINNLEYSYIKILDGQGLKQQMVQDIAEFVDLSIDAVIEDFRLVQATNGLYYNKYDLVKGLTFDHSVSFPLSSTFTFKLPDHLTFNQGFTAYGFLTGDTDIPSYEIGSYITVKSDFSYQYVKSIGSFFKVEGKLYVQLLLDRPFTVGESSSCQDCEIVIPDSMGIDLNLAPISLKNLTVSKSIEIRGGTIKRVSDLKATYIHIGCNILNLSNARCNQMDCHILSGNTTNCKVDALNVANCYIQTFPDIKIRKSLTINRSSDVIRFDRPLNLLGDLVIKAPVYNLPKNSLIVGKTLLTEQDNNNSLGRVDIPESFCSLGGIEYI